MTRHREHSYNQPLANDDAIAHHTKLEERAQRALRKKEYHKATDLFLDAFCEFALTSRTEKWHEDRFALLQHYCWMMTSDKVNPSEEDMETLDQVKSNIQETPLCRCHAAETRAWLLAHYYKDPFDACDEYQHALVLAKLIRKDQREKQTIAGKTNTKYYGMPEQMEDVRKRFVGDIIDFNVARIKFNLNALENDEDYDLYYAQPSEGSSSNAMPNTWSQRGEGSHSSNRRPSMGSRQGSGSRRSHQGGGSSRRSMEGNVKEVKSSHGKKKSSSKSKKKKGHKNNDNSNSSYSNSINLPKHNYYDSTETTTASTASEENNNHHNNNHNNNKWRDSSLMKVSEIKQELAGFGISSEHFVEKGEMVKALDRARKSPIYNSSIHVQQPNHQNKRQ